MRNEQLFGDIAGQPTFAGAYLAALESFHENGALHTVEQISENLRLTLSGELVHTTWWLTLAGSPRVVAVAENLCLAACHAGPAGPH